MSYSNKYTLNYNDYYSNACDVIIKEKDYAGANTDLDHFGKPPFVLSLKSGSTDKFKPLMLQSGEVELIGDSEDQWIELFDEDDKFKVITQVDSNTVFAGTILQETLRGDYKYPPTKERFSAIDGVSLLKDVPYNYHDLKAAFDGIGKWYSGRIRVLDYIRFALSLMPVGYNYLYIGCNIYHTGMDTTKSSFEETYFAAERFYTDDNKFSWYQVIDSIISIFGCKLFFYNNDWYIINLSEFIGNIRTIRYNSNIGSYTSSEQTVNFTQTLQASPRIGWLAKVTRTIERRISNYRYNIKRALVPNVYINGYFQEWYDNGNKVRGWRERGSHFIQQYGSERINGLIVSQRCEMLGIETFPYNQTLGYGFYPDTFYMRSPIKMFNIPSGLKARVKIKIKYKFRGRVTPDTLYANSDDFPMNVSIFPIITDDPVVDIFQTNLRGKYYSSNEEFTNSLDVANAPNNWHIKDTPSREWKEAELEIPWPDTTGYFRMVFSKPYYDPNDYTGATPPTHWFSFVLGFVEITYTLAEEVLGEGDPVSGEETYIPIPEKRTLFENTDPNGKREYKKDIFLCDGIDLKYDDIFYRFIYGESLYSALHYSTQATPENEYNPTFQWYRYSVDEGTFRTLLGHLNYDIAFQYSYNTHRLSGTLLGDGLYSKLVIQDPNDDNKYFLVFSRDYTTDRSLYDVELIEIQQPPAIAGDNTLEDIKDETDEGIAYQ